jgi:hypothetical protein
MEREGRKSAVMVKRLVPENSEFLYIMKRENVLMNTRDEKRCMYATW